MHVLKGVASKAWVGRVSGAPGHPYGFHQDAFVHPHWPQRGGLADDGRAGVQFALGQQLTGAGHAAFFVGGCQQREGLAQPVSAKGGGCFNGQGKKTLHVGGPQAVEPPVPCFKSVGVGAPKGRVAGHGVGVSGQDQPARASAEGGDQVVLAWRALDGVDPHCEAEGFEPVGQGIDDAAVALVQFRHGATHRGAGNQLGEHFDGVGCGAGDHGANRAQNRIVPTFYTPVTSPPSRGEGCYYGMHAPPRALNWPQRYRQ